MRKAAKWLGWSVGAVVAAFIIAVIVVAATGGGNSSRDQRASSSASAPPPQSSTSTTTRTATTSTSTTTPRATSSTSTTTRRATSTASATPRAPTRARIATPEATSFWRQQVAGQYQGTVPTDDGRGCAEASTDRWVCTAYVRNGSNQDIDVYGTVTVQGDSLTANARRVPSGNGGVIADWFTKTGGGCQTASCAGTRF